MACARKGWSRIQLTDGKILSIRRYPSFFASPAIESAAHLPERALPIAHSPFLGKRPEPFPAPSFMVLA